jgi:hypothetical protein
MVVHAVILPGASTSMRCLYICSKIYKTASNFTEEDETSTLGLPPPTESNGEHYQSASKMTALGPSIDQVL